MIRLFHAMLAAILGTGASAAQSPQVSPGVRRPTLPVVTYGASALGQPAGGVEETTNKNLKIKGELKVTKEIKTWEWKETIKNGKLVKLKYFPKQSNIKLDTDHKESINK